MPTSVARPPWKAVRASRLAARLALVDDAQLATRFGAIEQQLGLISQHLGIDCPPFASDGLVAL
jgi:hypothetical protein